MGNLIDWANQNDGFIGLLEVAIIGIALPVLFWATRGLSRRLSKAVSGEEVRRLEKIRDEIYGKLEFIDQEVAYGRVLIRDIARDKLYFDGDEEPCKGPPPSFRASIEDFDVFGMRIVCGWPKHIKPIEAGDWWCFADEGDSEAVLAYPVATLPFSMIEAVNWHGDPAFPYPHIYCRYEEPEGWPYKKMDWCKSVAHEVPFPRRYMMPVVGEAKLQQKKF